MEKRALGRGLDALIPPPLINIDEEDKGKRIVNLPLGDVIPNKFQPRKTFDEKKLEELANSIREKGVIQPIIVHKVEDKYEIVTGERRWRAVQKTGFKDIPAIIRDVSEKEKLELALIENIQREDLNPLEEAEAYKEIMERLSLTHEEVAKRVGKERCTISNSVRLLKLPEEIKCALISNTITTGHARAILTLEEEKQTTLCKEIVEKKLTVRDTENYVKEIVQRKKEKASELTSKVASETINKSSETVEVLAIKDIQAELTRVLGTKVVIKSKGNNKKGTIEIDYYSLDDLDRILVIFKAEQS
ncbi:MAG: ParB/RepB/Spo0J family partition protein [bacterium]